ncbi:type II toxin-antitoxin system HicB family antitoxin [Candidatus Peregrinibacteria bacterium]|nr:MAG: type II toxin-antitoxin system HicB family antitoxin [Candidatus Peregrinibacteria bacterium]
MKTFTFSAVVYKDGKLYVAECPQVGTVSQGESVELALANLKEATELYLEEFPEYTTSNPLLTTFEVSHA